MKVLIASFLIFSSSLSFAGKNYGMDEVTVDFKINGEAEAKRERKALKILADIFTSNFSTRMFQTPLKGKDFYVSCEGVSAQILIGVGASNCVLWSLNSKAYVEYYPAKQYTLKVGTGAGFGVTKSATVKVRNAKSLTELSGFSISLETGVLGSDLVWGSMNDHLGLGGLDVKMGLGVYVNALSVVPNLIIRDKKAVKNGFQLNDEMKNLLY